MVLYWTARLITIIGSIFIILGTILGMFVIPPTSKSMIGGIALLITNFILFDIPGMISDRLKINFTRCTLRFLVLLEVAIALLSYPMIYYILLGIFIQSVPISGWHRISLTDDDNWDR